MRQVRPKVRSAVGVDVQTDDATVRTVVRLWRVGVQAMTRNEFIQRAAIAIASQSVSPDPKRAWEDAAALADAAPKGTFDAVQATTRSTPASSGSSAGGVFPPFGQTKGEPIAGATERNIRFYAHAAMRTLDDPDKARFHDKERAQLALYVAELERQGKDASEFKRAPSQRQDDPPEPAMRQVPDDSDQPLPF